jgi:hypothetical protein
VTFGLGTLMDAARAARQASTDGRVVTISITEEGFVILAAKDGRCAAIDIGWHELDMHEGLLANAVLLVKDRV